jgi:hypothetical protein
LRCAGLDGFADGDFVLDLDFDSDGFIGVVGVYSSCRVVESSGAVCEWCGREGAIDEIICF